MDKKRKPCSPETAEKIRKAHSGKKLTKEHKKKIGFSAKGRSRRKKVPSDVEQVWKKIRKVEGEFSSDEAFAYLVGYWMGDGFKTILNLGFAVRDDNRYIQNLVRLTSLALKIPIVKYRYSSEGCTLHFYKETRSLKSRIVSEIESQKFIQKYPWHFLGGFLDSDGWICCSDRKARKDSRGSVQIAFCNTNFGYISITSKILEELCIPHQVSLGYGSGDHCKALWNLYIHGPAAVYVFSHRILPITIGEKKKTLCLDFIDYYEKEYLAHSLPICETFASVQGEGKNIGRLQFFIRASTCSMHCKICDSKYSWKRGKEVTLYELVRLAEQSGLQEVCLTGGEIAQFRNKMMALVAFLRVRDLHIILQTNGLHCNSSFGLIHTVSMDMKTPSTGEKSNEDLIFKLKPKDEVKTLIQDEKDYRYALRINKKVVSVGCSQVLQPLNLISKDNTMTLLDKYKWICDLVLKDSRWKNVRVIPQLHVFLWGNKRGV